jgi:signal transduction histidine kinase
MFGFHRRYVLIPLVLTIALLMTMYAAGDRAQTRLSDSGNLIQESLQRQTLISDFMVMMLDAETGQRGFLISTRPSYLEPYRLALMQRRPAIAALRKAYRNSPAIGLLLDDLDELVAECFDQMERSLQLEATAHGAAMTFVASGSGKRTMDRIRGVIMELQRRESATLATMLQAESRDLQLYHLISASATTLNLALVLLAGWLISRNIQRRTKDALSLLAEKQSLETLVSDRTVELVTLSNHLQNVTETEKAALARELHDELGGLLVAAKMDLAWLRRRTSQQDPAANTRWDRIMAMMDSGVDFKRRVVEQLRPTLLDNMGLHAALRWQLHESCDRAGIKCHERLPERELSLSSEASIAIFRIAQEALTNILKHARASEVTLAVEVWAEEICLTVEDNGVGLGSNSWSRPSSHGLMSMRHRVSSLGGKWAIRPGPGGKGTQIEVRLPLARILRVATTA